MKRTFEMNGKSYNTLTAIAAELGVKRVYTRDFAKYGITEITATANNTIVAINKSVNILDDDATTDDDTTQADDTTVQAIVADDKVDTATDMADPLNTGGSAIIFAHTTTSGIAVDKVIDISSQAAINTTADTVADTATADVQNDTADTVADTATADVQNDTADTVADTATVDVTTPSQPVVSSQPQTEEEQIAQIEKDVVDYADAAELGKAVKKISLPGLVKMVEHIQGDTWARISNEGIRKMRLIMELKKGYFPTSQPTKVSSGSGASPWKKISTTDLIAAATATGKTWKDCSNEGILRMRLIMVLKAAGVTADTLTK